MVSSVFKFVGGAYFVLAFLTTVPVQAMEQTSESRSRFMRVFGPVAPPPGHAAFCARHNGACRGSARPQHARIEMTPQRWNDLKTVNDVANSTVVAVSDQQLYGVKEHWTLPQHRGDCEDFVLLKQRMLRQRGWPVHALLIAVVLDENDEGHAVLVIRSSAGDLVLDNRRSEIAFWHELPYRFVKRQSYRDPRAWVALHPALRKQVVDTPLPIWDAIGRF